MRENNKGFESTEKGKRMSLAVPQIDVEKCDGCGECLTLCPAGAVALVEGKAFIARPEDCTYCTECEGLCPAGAIRCPFEIILVEENIQQ